MDALSAIQQRHACRAFLNTPVSPEHVQQILQAARWAPSGVNTQPWHVHILTGTAKARLSEALIAARQANTAINPDYAYYPEQWLSPYTERRRSCGLSLYKALDIKKDDPDGQMQAWNNNYTFFGAPVGMMFTLDKIMGKGSWLDMGMFLQNIMLAAVELGLATCPQVSLVDYPDIIRSQLSLDTDQIVLCGMSLGYPDTDHPVNQYRLEREPVAAFSTWHEA